MTMFGAYLEQNTVNGKFYAGKGEWKKRRQNRVSSYLQPKSSWYNSAILRAYRKHGPNSFIPHTLCWFETEEQALNQERQWIRELDLMNPLNGYNMTEGGDGLSGFKWNEDQLLRLSLSHKGKKPANFPTLHSPENRRKAGLALKGRKRPSEVMDRCRATFLKNGKTRGRPSPLRKTHCLRGHLFPPIEVVGKRRQCKECMKIYNANRRVTKEIF